MMLRTILKLHIQIVYMYGNIAIKISEIKYHV